MIWNFPVNLATKNNNIDASINLVVISVMGGKDCMATLVQMNENDQNIIAKTMAEYNLIDLNICAGLGNHVFYLGMNLIPNFIIHFSSQNLYYISRN